jgi:hypothetical protein
MKRSQWFSIVVMMTVSLFLTFSCAGPGGSDEKKIDAKTSAVLKATLPLKARNALFNALGTVDEVVSVTVEVIETGSDPSNIIAAETDLTETPSGSGNWELTLEGLPVDTDLDFIGKAYNLDDVVIFTGTVTQALTDGGENNVVLRLTSVDDGIEPSNPKIVSITIAEEIEVNSTGNTIAFLIEHSGPVDYTVEVEHGSITSNETGQHDPSDGPLSVSYDAPGFAVDDFIALTIQDPNADDLVGAVYPINVVEIVRSSNVTVLFGPAIIGMDFLRKSDSLEITTLTDPENGLDYDWTGADDFANAFTDPTANPAIIDAYTDTASGTITVTVTDSNGISASLTRTVNAGDFPYLINRPQAAENGTLVGTVRDAVSSDPLADVDITVSRHHTVVGTTATDTDGNYSLTLPAATGYVLNFSKDGHISVDFSNITITAAQTTYMETVLQIDSVYEGTGTITGIITDALTGVGLGGITVDLRSGINAISGTVVASTETESDGRYTIGALEAGHYTAQLSGSGYNITFITVVCLGGTTNDNQNGTITPELTTDEVRIILTWGATPYDLDSHLTLPISESERRHVWYSNRDVYVDGSLVANLDVDDTSSYGPETITIYRSVEGVLRYSVHDYSNQSNTTSTALAGSNAKVEVYRGAVLLATYHVPNQMGTFWVVFEMEDDQLRPINMVGNDYPAELHPSAPISSGAYFFEHVEQEGGSGSFQYTTDLGTTPKDVYFIFTNTNTEDIETPTTVETAQYQLKPAWLGSATGSAALPVDSDLEEWARTQGVGLRGTPWATEFNSHPPAKTFGYQLNAIAKPVFNSVGDTHSFKNESVSDTIAATLRKVSVAGDVTLNLWVADDSWDEECGKWYCIDQTMVDAYADKFLQSGLDNDVYDWVTTIFGAPWGNHSSGNMIPETAAQAIDILFFDISNDGNLTDDEPHGGYLGFFWAKDNYLASTVEHSNERLIFYMDSVLSAKPDGESWDISDDWPSEMISTLAHEFQHMIHFYQKYVLRSAESETWINEMASLITEDLLADKLGVNGPRGVTFNDWSAGSPANTAGRLPFFNYYKYIGPTVWYSGMSALINYSVNYAFGSYLARNFGGAELFREIVQNSGTDEQAIIMALDAIGYQETFDSLLQKWGVAVLLSDQTDLTGGYRYNTGGAFTTIVDGIAYNLGSIDLFNYTYGSLTGPLLLSPTDLSDLDGHYQTSNTYVQVGTAETGVFSRTIDMATDVVLTVVAKDSY